MLPDDAGKELELNTEGSRDFDTIRHPGSSCYQQGVKEWCGCIVRNFLSHINNKALGRLSGLLLGFMYRRVL